MEEQTNVQVEESNNDTQHQTLHEESKEEKNLSENSDEVKTQDPKDEEYIDMLEPLVEEPEIDSDEIPDH